MVLAPWLIAATFVLGTIELVSVHGGFTGLVMSANFAFPDPGALRTVAFERLPETGIGTGGG
ncbi:hypothetical protein ATO8_18964 [Roseivivax marinus]|uniref:Uncharacterized protein n=1 Tax=Roseivivax marinus TaxID=1379903 RepID=W4HGK4_9RHOB|nr:hypothetical protein [Roseivivax marinus]ETW11130.1 hypothetical protein ATO8_18964 [Roseivivax marinus]UMA65409.1 hypothetical protein LVO79_02795 [Roseivivax marinus]